MFTMPDALVIVGILGTVIVGMLRFGKMRSPENSNYVYQDVFEITIKSVLDTMTRIEKSLGDKIDDLKKVLDAVLRRG